MNMDTAMMKKTARKKFLYIISIISF